MPRASRQSGPAPADLETADRLHSAAIHLLRRLRVVDVAAGLTPPKISALSVVVFGGPISLGELAAAEQVRPPTITRLVRALERDGLVERITDATDRRIQRVRATTRGRKLLEEGRTRRVERLAADLAALAPAERRLLAAAAHVLARVTGPARPHSGGTPRTR